MKLLKPIQTFTIVPSLPKELQPLLEIANNLFWTWDRETIELFRRLDRDLWNETNHNPILMLGKISQSQLESAANDDSFIAHMERVYKNLKDYMSAQTWYDRTYGKETSPFVAYFSAEFGITESIPIYSGGLGILAADYLKSSSDLGVPIVGVGLLYQKGYFRQRLNSDGWQQEDYPDNDFFNMAIQLERNEDGSPKTFTMDFPDGPVHIQIWRAQIGRISLFLLDTNIIANTREEYRNITDQLYVADQEKRIRQEIILGMGGVRALRLLGIHPIVYHMNEGHSAFLALERIHILMHEHQLSFDEAKEVVSVTNLFTTHTPEAAGIDVFPPYLIQKYLSNVCSSLNISLNDLLALGRQNPWDPNEGFSMAVLALHLSAHSNGVSRLHGKVSRKMWKNLWPGLPEDEVPIGSITNGVHLRSWVSNDMETLFDRYVGNWRNGDVTDPRIWERIEHIPDDELWRTHERRRERLVAFARTRLEMQLKRRGATQLEIDEARQCLNPEALTIGFARRFASYKRASLLLSDPDRIANLLLNKERPVQIIYAGKAHPQDEIGKRLLRNIIHIAQREEFRNHIVFIEDYDTNIARYLVQGCDLWLNTPRRLREASGTSGMKAAINGVINMSVIDGWWYEAYSPNIGWSIGQEESYKNEAEQDEVEFNAIYNILEKEVIPMFYDRGPDNVPKKWVEKMKNIMIAVCPVYNTDRMLKDYINNFYLACLNHWKNLSTDNFIKAKEIVAWKKHLRENWSSIRIDNVSMDQVSEVKVGSLINLRAQIYLGALTPDDVVVEIYKGPIDPNDGSIISAETIHMNFTESYGNGCYVFEGSIQCRTTGLYGYTVRVLPRHEEPNSYYEPGLIVWAS